MCHLRKDTSLSRVYTQRLLAFIAKLLVFSKELKDNKFPHFSNQHLLLLAQQMYNILDKLHEKFYRRFKDIIKTENKITLLTCPSFFHVASRPDNLQLVLTDLHCDKTITGAQFCEVCRLT
jgi:hypothetical protein